jgi:hypothetical protein
MTDLPKLTCPVCPREFCDVFPWADHVLSHEEFAVVRKDKNNLICPLCHQGFRGRRAWGEHVLSKKRHVKNKNIYDYSREKKMKEKHAVGEPHVVEISEKAMSSRRPKPTSWQSPTKKQLKYWARSPDPGGGPIRIWRADEKEEKTR